MIFSRCTIRLRNIGQRNPQIQANENCSLLLLETRHTTPETIEEASNVIEQYQELNEMMWHAMCVLIHNKKKTIKEIDPDWA